VKTRLSEKTTGGKDASESRRNVGGEGGGWVVAVGARRAILIMAIIPRNDRTLVRSENRGRS